MVEGRHEAADGRVWPAEDVAPGLHLAMLDPAAGGDDLGSDGVGLEPPDQAVRTRRLLEDAAGRELQEQLALAAQRHRGEAPELRAGVVLDFAGVRFVNSSNIAQLLSLRKKVVATEGRLLFCGVKDHVWSAFRVTGLDKLFEQAPDVSTALASIQLGLPTR